MANSFQQFFTKVTGGLWSRYGGQGWTRFRFLMPGSRFDYEKEAGDLWMNPVVGLCLDWLGNRFPRPLLHVSKIDARSGDYKPLGRHPLTNLWDRPNAFYSRRTMEKAIGLSLKVDGNAYIYKVRDNGGRPVELWWLPHFRVMPTWPADGSIYVDGYKVRLDNVIYELPPEDIIHIRDGIDPRNERLGLCALRSNIREVCTINEESGYRAAILRNSGVPGLVVIPEADNLRPSQADADTIRERLHETTGGDNRGQSIVLGGRYKVEVIGFSPEQLNLIEFPVIPTARILSSMGVAPMSVGLPDPGKTYANLGEANRSSWGTIVATQELVAEALRWSLLPEFGDDPYGLTCEYDYTHIQELQESLDAIHTRAREDWKAGLQQLNEAREMIGLEPDPDGDRWFPGTGDPAEIERQQEQQAQRAEAMAQQSALAKPDQNVKPGENGNGKPKELVDGNGEGEKRFPFDFDTDDKYNHYHGPDGRFVGGGHGAHGGGGHATGTATPLSARPGGAPLPKKPAAHGGGGGGGGGGGKESKPAATAERGKQATGMDMAGKPASEVSKVHKDMDAGWRKGLTESEHQSLRIYTGASFAPMNASLRNPKTAKETERSPLVRDADKAIAKSSLKQDTVVYRGIQNPASLGLAPGKAIGATIKDPGFLSTSIDPKVAHKYAGDGGAVLKISAPKGSKGASMGGISRYPKEHEVLFARGSGYKITGVSKEGGRTVYHAELIQGK